MAGERTGGRAVDNVRRTWSKLVAVGRQQLPLAVIAGAALLGIGVSLYLTVEHYAKAEPFCPVGGLVNCARVLASRYSVMPGTQLPITIPGLLWFLISGGLALVALASAYRSVPEQVWLRSTLLVWSAAGLLFVLYLVYAEIVLVRYICLWCTVIHVLTLVMFLGALVAWQKGRPTIQLERPGRPNPLERRTKSNRTVAETKGNSVYLARRAPPRPPRSRRH